jgi:RNA polymerase sigma factor (sigma-70 family)
MSQPLSQPDSPAEQGSLPADSSRAEINKPGSRQGAAVADARLASEYDSLKRWLMEILHHRYRLPFEDCEEIVNDVLLAWHRQLCTPKGVRNDRAFCATVLRSRAIDRLRRRTVPTIELSLIENLAVDLEVDALVAEREELRDLNEVAMEGLKPREYAIVRLVASGVRRPVVAKRFGLRPRQVKRVHDRARPKLAAARARLEEQGRCGMVATTIADISAGVIDADDPRRGGATKHLAQCPWCRRSQTIRFGHAFPIERKEHDES